MQQYEVITKNFENFYWPVRQRWDSVTN